MNLTPTESRIARILEFRRNSEVFLPTASQVKAVRTALLPHLPGASSESKHDIPSWLGGPSRRGILELNEREGEREKKRKREQPDSGGTLARSR